MKIRYINLFAILALNSCNQCGETEAPTGNENPPPTEKNQGNGEDESPENEEYRTVLSKTFNSTNKEEIENLFNTDELRKLLSSFIKNNPMILDILNKGNHPRRDDTSWDSNYLQALCEHGENIIFISDTDSNHIYIRSFEKNSDFTDKGIICCLNKKGTTWNPIQSKILTRQTFQDLLSAANNIALTDKNIISRFLLENIDKFEGVLIFPNTNASTAGNFAVSADNQSIVDYNGKTLKAKADNSGVEFAA